MNQIAGFTLIIVPALLVLSCGEQRKEADSHGRAEGSDQYSQDDASVNGHGLVLNGVEKWRMDAHTRSVFAKMTDSFRSGGIESGDTGSVKATGEKIRGEIDELIQGCTMTGEAHNQLHKYLMVYIPAVERMADGGTKTQAESVGTLLELYPKYFE